jgi:glycosidase
MKNLLSVLVILFLFISCENKKEEAKVEVKNSKDAELKHVDWSKNATIYEANIRQMTPEGTFKALEEELINIKELGVKIIWLMPIQPIGVLHRKGTLGSYYSIQDYKGVNPEFGDLNDFKSLVNKAHSMDMKIIMDWVANHTAWDHEWTVDHPEWYTKDSLGNFTPPVADWSDVIDLNYDNLDMRKEMINDMKYWLNETDIDGFRCDVAGMVPVDFWNDVRTQLDKVKPVFMLAEAEQEDLQEKAFDMTYGWELMHIMNHIAEGDTAFSLQSIDDYMQKEQKRFPKNDYRMYFLTNHDENSWNGTIEERFGAAERAYAVLAFTIYGMPLIYSGQEYGNTNSLAFFEKDTPNYAQPDISTFYSALMHLNKKNEALWNGNYGGDYNRIITSDDKNIFALKRQKGDAVVVAISNFSDQEIIFTLKMGELFTLNDLFSNQEIVVDNEQEMVLPPYGYRVLNK